MYTHICEYMSHQLKKIEGMNLKKSKKEYIGRFVAGKREGINALIIVSKGEKWEKNP